MGHPPALPIRKEAKPDQRALQAAALSPSTQTAAEQGGRYGGTAQDVAWIAGQAGETPSRWSNSTALGSTPFLLQGFLINEFDDLENMRPALPQVVVDLDMQPSAGVIRGRIEQNLKDANTPAISEASARATQSRVRSSRRKSAKRSPNLPRHDRVGTTSGQRDWTSSTSKP
jgi:hypothetical protein